MPGIRDVPDIPDLMAQMHQVTVQDVKGDERSGMTQMTLSTHRRSAHIHADMSGSDRLEHLFLSRKRVEETQGWHDEGLVMKKEYGSAKLLLFSHSEVRYDGLMV